MVYRDPAQGPRADAEAVAVRELADRAAKLRRAVLLPAIVAGVAGAIAGYLAVREIQFALFHVQLPWLSGLLGSLPPLAGGARIGQALGNALVARRAPAWLEAATQRHALPRGTLDDYRAVL